MGRRFGAGEDLASCEQNITRNRTWRWWKHKVKKNRCMDVGGGGWVKVGHNKLSTGIL